MPVENRPTLPYARESTPRWSRRQIIKKSIAAGVLACALHGARALDRWATQTHCTRTDAAKVTLQHISYALDCYCTDTGAYPSNIQGLNALMTNCTNTPGWNGPYLYLLPVDPWGSAYQYSVHPVGKKADYIIRSAGPDRLYGNADDVICRSADDDF